MPPEESESLKFLKIGEAVSQGLLDGLKPLYPLEEVEEDPVWAEDWIKENPYCPQVIEAARNVATITLRIIDNLMPSVIKAYAFSQRPDNKRLIHLARLSKKKRTRKKNLHRLLEKYKKENKRSLI